MVANLLLADTDEMLSTQEYLVGNTVASLHRLRDIDNTDGGFFVFGDLYIKHQGRYRLQFSLFEIIDGELHTRQTILSEPFKTHMPKTYPGPIEATFLSRCFNDQGVKMRIRKEHKAHTAKRKRHFEMQNVVESHYPKSYRMISPTQSPPPAHVHPTTAPSSMTPSIVKPEPMNNFMTRTPPPQAVTPLASPPRHHQRHHSQSHHPYAHPPTSHTPTPPHARPWLIESSPEPRLPHQKSSQSPQMPMYAHLDDFPVNHLDDYALHHPHTPSCSSSTTSTSSSASLLHDHVHGLPPMASSPPHIAYASGNTPRLSQPTWGHALPPLKQIMEPHYHTRTPLVLPSPF
ncbi:velvet factor-domain-containing protein [Gongronella butleri]|nr:velvet factor-domain-containing protein [Gongronella butleri]